ncbi:MAG: amino acid permease [Armatimonadetes bacterium]|nr:amino acid permease [Armatimonadota bacterium]
MADSSSSPSAPTLVRTLGLWSLVIYGVGDMLGSGIYALVGKVAGVMGNAVWVAFLASMVAAMLTGLSYASLGSRYPRAAGAAYISHRAFGKPFLSYLVGLAVMASGLTSMAAQSRAFSGYLSPILSGLPLEVIILGFIAVLTFVNFWGVRESMWLNIVCTAVEVTGLAIIVAVGMRFWGSVNYLETPAAGSAASAFSLSLILQGSVLTFYAFVGFEDMINIVEEVKNPQRVFPRAVALALAITAVIYMAVSVSAISVVPHRDLAASREPLVEVVRRAAPAFPTILFTAISLFAITNTALLNYIMGSRLVYGMARLGFVPRVLGTVHPVRRTPYIAILALMGIVVVLALSGDLKILASATSALLLSVFVAINASLILLKTRPGEPEGFFEIPVFVPAAGIAVCLLMLSHAQPEALKIAAGLLAGIALLYCLARPKNITEESLTEMGD